MLSSRSKLGLLYSLIVLPLATPSALSLFLVPDLSLKQRVPLSFYPCLESKDCLSFSHRNPIHQSS